MSARTERGPEEFQRDARQMLTVRRQDADQALIEQLDAVRVLRESLDSGAADVLDRATVRAEADELALLVARLRSQLDDLATAIERCDVGTYGICERCGARIPDERLAMLPSATHCVPCMRAQPSP